VFELGRDIDEILCVFDFGATSEVESEEFRGGRREGSEGSLSGDGSTESGGESAEHGSRGLARGKREVSSWVDKVRGKGI